MKNKGFSLMELLTALIIVAIVAVITVPIVLNVLTTMRKKAFIESEKGLIRAATNYLNFNEELYPQNIGDMTELSIQTLVDEEFTREVKNPVDDTLCSGYIMVKKIAEEEYEYYPEYKCGTSKTITSSTLDSLVLNYNFNDFQEPTTNLNNNALFMDINGNPSTLNYGTWGFGDGNSLESVTLASAITGGRSIKATKVNATGTGATVVRASYTHAALPLNSKSTYTVYAKGEGNSIGKYLRMWTYCNSATGALSTGITTAGPLTDTWERYEYTFTWTKSDATCYANGLNTYTRIDSLNIGDYFFVSNPQLELKSYSTPFVNGTRTGTVTDYSGNGKNAILSSTTTPRWVFDTDRNSGAYQFSNNQITFGTGDTIFPLNTFAMSAWIKTPGLGSGMSLNGIASVTYGLSMFLTSTGNLSFRMDDGVGLPYISVSKSLHDNKFHHVVVQFDGTNRKMYIDGELMMTSAFTGWTGSTRWPTNSAVIGHENNNSPIYKFNGVIDNFRLYKRALSDAEIKTLYYIEGSR